MHDAPGASDGPGALPAPQATRAPALPTSCAPATFVNPVIDTGPGRDHGDPFVLRHQGRYYLYYTGATGIEVHVSDDLAVWRRAGTALVAPERDCWAETDLWAPEVLYAGGVFYMYVTGTRHAAGGHATHPGAGVGVNHGDDSQRRQGVARSRDPLGPFVLDPEPLLQVWSIDGHPFTDEDGRRYLFYNVRDDSTWYRSEVPGCGNIVDELVAPDAVTGLPSPVTVPSVAWEGNTERTWYWNEGPTVLRRRGRYVQMYSGGYYGDGTYSVGFATADAPRGPWQKAPHNPVFRSGDRITGPGHHSIVRGPDGVTPYAIYHGYVDGWPGRKIHVDRLHWSTEGPRIGDGGLPGVPTQEPQPLPDRAAHDPEIPYWHAELWVRATAVRLGDLRIGLDGDAPVLLDVAQREGRARVLVDGRLVADGEPSGDPAAVAEGLRSGAAVQGEVLSLVLATWREDEDLRILEAGEVTRIPWGGSLPVELSAAVQGSALLRLASGGGSDTAGTGTGAGAEYAARSTGLPELVRLRSDVPVTHLEITAGPEGAVVSDVVLTARPGSTDVRGSGPAPATRLDLTAAADATGPIDLATAIPEPRESED